MNYFFLQFFLKEKTEQKNLKLFNWIKLFNAINFCLKKIFF